MSERVQPQTLEEAYRLRDGAGDFEERDFYQEQVFRLRREEYRGRGIRTEISSRRRERQRDLEFSREMFFLEVSEIVGQQDTDEPRTVQREALRHASRLDAHACLEQFDSPNSGSVEAYRRNFLELLRMGQPPKEAYYLSRVIGPVGEDECRAALEGVRRDGYPKGGMLYAVERLMIRGRGLPGGMGLILLTFFASLFTFVRAAEKWGNASAGVIVFVALGVIATGALMLVCAFFIAASVRSINK